MHVLDLNQCSKSSVNNVSITAKRVRTDFGFSFSNLIRFALGNLLIRGICSSHGYATKT